MVREGEVLHVSVEKKTEGGDTYWVEYPKWRGDEKAICYRRLRMAGRNEEIPDDARCSQPAGYGTWHSGTGACRFHGGAATGEYNIKTGRRASMKQRQLKHAIDEYIQSGDRDSMLDLTYELAAMRIMFKDTIANFPDIDDKKYSANVGRAIAMVQATGSLVDKISKIQSRNNITAAQVMYLKVIMTDILVKHIPNIDKRERAVRDLAAMIPGGEGDSETRLVIMQ